MESLASLLHGMRRVVWLPSVLAALDGGFQTTNWCFLDFRREMAHKMIDGHMLWNLYILELNISDI